MFAQTRYQNTFLPSRSWVMNVLIVLLGSIVLAAASQVVIPWAPVPFTLQSAMVVLLGLALGPRRAVIAVGLYLFEGAIGLPVFAEWSAGIPVLFGATAGYLFGFIPATFLAGWLMQRGMANNIVSIFIAAVTSSAVIFLFGYLHLATMLGFHKAYIFGVQPFLLTELLKLAVTALIAKGCWKESH